MNEQQLAIAEQIFQKSSSDWSNEDWGFLDTLISLGMRTRLKELRQEVQNAVQQAQTQT